MDELNRIFLKYSGLAVYTNVNGEPLYKDETTNRAREELIALVKSLEAKSHMRCYCGRTWQTKGGWDAQGLYTSHDDFIHNLDTACVPA
jgi:hypothetical protein